MSDTHTHPHPPIGVSHLLQPSTLSEPDLGLDGGQRTLKWPAVFQFKGDSIFPGAR